MILRFMWHYCFLIFIVVLARHSTAYNCNLLDSNSDKEKTLSKLDPLKGESFHIIENEGIHTSYHFDFKICAPAVSDKKIQDVGMVQTIIKSGKTTKYNLGKYTKAAIDCGENWIFLRYGDGDSYTKTCDKGARSASIMIVCDPLSVAGKVQVLESSNGTTPGKCNFLFMLKSSVACNSKEQQSLSSGSIFCIIFFSALIGYFLLGFLYQRFVVGAKGLEQIPNLSFWLELGELEADGCDFTFRWRTRRNHCEYKGIDSDLRQNTSVMDDDESSDRDDHLLPV